MFNNVVLYSTPESRKNRQVSVLACIEIVWSVFLYWLIWYWFDTYLHFLSSLLVAPLLLLRSPESIQAGVDWWESKNKWNPDLRRMTFWMIGVGFLIMTVLTWMFGRSILEYEVVVLNTPIIGVGLYVVVTAIAIPSAIVVAAVAGVADTVKTSSVVIGTSVVIAIITAFTVIVVTIVVVDYSEFGFAAVFIGASAAFSVVFFVTTTLAVVFMVVPFFWVLTLIVRFSATALNLKKGIQNFATNWYEAMFVQDVLRSSSLIPGFYPLSLEALWEKYHRDKAGGEFLFSFSLASIATTTAALYRWSIKGSFWFYWPLVFVQRGEFPDVVKREMFFRSRLFSPMEWFRLFLAVITFIGVAWAVVSGWRLLEIHRTDPAFIFAYLFAIDISAIKTIKPWQWLQLITAVLTVVLFFLACKLNIQRQSHEKHNSEFDWQRPVDRLHKIYRARVLSTWLYLPIVLVFALALILFQRESTCAWVPEAFVTWFTEFFGSKLNCG